LDGRTAFPAPLLSPACLSATPGNALAVLAWTTSAGATSYNVKRSTISGGSHTNLATGVTATNYTNVGLTNGALYYFLVSGLNVAGESGNSSEVSARPLSLIPPPLSLVIASGQ